MLPEEFAFIILYFLFCMCIVAPPTEFVSSGLTIQSAFANFLGSEQLDFVGYHIRRTTVTLVIHSLLPFGFAIGYSLFSEGKIYAIDLEHYSPVWNAVSLFSILLAICCATLGFYWMNSNWNKHPIAKRLKNLATADAGWRSVASSINVEFRRFDKFTTGTYGRRLVVTDTWLILTSDYLLHVARQADTHLTIVDSENHGMHYERATGVQVLNILVTSADLNISPFKIRLIATEYNDLREKLSSPILNIRNIVIQQSLSDQFVEAFRYQVNLNSRYTLPAGVELENCIGCMQVVSNVKLKKCCSSDLTPQQHDNNNARASSQPCASCKCRPMWCLECMGKWFASRQNQNEPETWLSGKSPCPTCRAVFCMLDICLLR